MDLLYRRYADPLSLLDQMISAGQLSQYIAEVCRLEEDDRIWAYYLHKVYDDQTYEQFKAALSGPERSTVTDGQIAQTINDTAKILSGFQPTEKEGDVNGRISNI